MQGADMKTSNSVRAIVTVSGSFLLALSAWAQQTAAPSAPATPAVQKVSVKGTARFDFDKLAVTVRYWTDLKEEAVPFKLEPAKK